MVASAAPRPMPQHSNKCPFAPTQIPPVSAEKHNGAGIDLVLNDAWLF